ncbi:3-deoxy-7-phosphoheptulonate synthase [Caldinitratiruptor microaerophilus]|nr:3-deoxy-7-phosphoheptulonate synthase [Caldinitratiruptor microaerophilus]
MPMIIVMRKGATEEEIADVVERVERAGFGVHLSRGEESTIVGVIGGDRASLEALGSSLEGHPGVARTMRVTKPYKLVSREFHPEDTVVEVGGVRFGGGEVPVIAGPCAVEGRELYLEAAFAAREAGATVLRGGAYKPRSSPYTFQGLGEEGLEILAEARERTGLPVCTEVMDPESVPLVARYADILQVGARNAQNYPLLRALGQIDRPVLLKRGFGTTIEEWLSAAEYILAGGNSQVILCERGIRTFETATRFTLDVAAVPVVRQLTHLPVVVDPSHAAGKRQWVAALARAAVAAGADGLEVEVHPRPDESVSDAAQALSPEAFRQMMDEIAAIAAVLGRRVPLPTAHTRPAAGAPVAPVGD